MKIIEEVEKHRKEIFTDTYTVTWRELIGQFKDEDLIIDPEYQRLFRWDIDQQTQYIESILLNIPSPPIFLARNDDGKFEVIDGLQRISTMLKFFAHDIFGKQPLMPEELQELEQNNIHISTKLTAAPFLSSLEDFTAVTLPETLIRTIKYARITIILLEKESTKETRYEVFRRLNKLGSPLSDQEIRNCTARLLGKEFPAQLRTLAKVQAVRSALTLNEDAERSMGVEEMVLRMLALSYSTKTLKHQIREYLDDFMAFAAEGKFNLSEDVVRRIEATFSLIQDALPNGSAFRFPNQGFSTNLYDVVATGVHQNIERLSTATLKEKHNALMNSTELREVTGAGSNTRRKLQGRIDLGKKWFAY